MQDRYSLTQFLSLYPTEQEMVNVFYQLDSQMKYIHEQGCYIPLIDSDTIFYEDDVFVFNAVKRIDNKEENIASNITDLTRLAINSFMTVGIDTLEDTRISDYYQSVILDGVNTMYLSDALATKDMSSSESNANSKKHVKANAVGMALGRSDDAGFVRIVFYPIIISLLLTFIYVIVNVV